MKENNFYVFYSEKDEVHLKLVKLYTNRFCIDEDDQNEVIEFKPVGEISETTFTLWMLQYLNLLKSYNGFRTQVFRTLANAISETWKNQSDQFHFLLGIPVNYFTKSISIFLADNQSKVTLLDGQIEKSNRHGDPNKLRNKFTIGDDVELLNDEPNIRDTFSVGIEGLSVFQNSDESFGIIKYNRKSYSGFWTFLKNVWPFKHLFFVIVLLIIDDLTSKGLEQGIETVNFDSRSWFIFYMVSFQGFQQISRVTAIFYFLWKILMRFYALIAISFLNSIKYSRPIQFICVKFNRLIFIRTFLVLLFLLSILFFIREIYYQTASLIESISSIHIKSEYLEFQFKNN